MNCVVNWHFLVDYIISVYVIVILSLVISYLLFLFYLLILCSMPVLYHVDIQLMNT